jgi:hypothetical protein
LVREATPSGIGISDALLHGLRFNGMTAVANGSDYRELIATDATTPKLAQELAAWRPNVVVMQIAGTRFEPIVQALFDNSSRDAAVPFVVSAGPMYDAIAPFSGRDPARRRRFFGVSPLSTTVANARLVTQLNAAFDDHVTRASSPNTAYDAFYVAAYATLAAPQTTVRGETLRGEDLATAIARVTGGTRHFEVGPSTVFDAFSELTAGRSIALDGATGALRFDLKTGEVAYDMAILCVGIDDAGAAGDGVESGLVFNGAKRALTGAMKCP